MNNTTTTETLVSEEPCFVIPSELSGKVSRRQLSEFVLSGKISEYDLQLSPDAFALDLKNKNIVASNPVAILIGAIKNNGSYNSAKYQELKKTDPEAFEKHIEKYKKQGLKNETLLDDFGFMEFQELNENQHSKLADPFRPEKV